MPEKTTVNFEIDASSYVKKYRRLVVATFAAHLSLRKDPKCMRVAPSSLRHLQTQQYGILPFQAVEVDDTAYYIAGDGMPVSEYRHNWEQVFDITFDPAWVPIPRVECQYDEVSAVVHCRATLR